MILRCLAHLSPSWLLRPLCSSRVSCPKLTFSKWPNLLDSTWRTSSGSVRVTVGMGPNQVTEFLPAQCPRTCYSASTLKCYISERAVSPLPCSFMPWWTSGKALGTMPWKPGGRGGRDLASRPSRSASGACRGRPAPAAPVAGGAASATPTPPLARRTTRRRRGPRTAAAAEAAPSSGKETRRAIPLPRSSTWLVWAFRN
jgi:hypothetical protein